MNDYPDFNNKVALVTGVCIACRDLERSVRFYEKLGFKVIKRLGVVKLMLSLPRELRGCSGSGRNCQGSLMGLLPGFIGIFGCSLGVRLPLIAALTSIGRR